MKRFFGRLFPAFLIAVTMTSCGEGTSEKIESTTDSLVSKVGEGVDKLGNRVDSMNIGGKDDGDFLEDAVEMNTMEMRLLMIGQQRGGKEVKAHAKHMLADHKKMAEQVKDYLTKKNLTLSVDTANNDNDWNNRQAGADFDRAFADRMVSDHEKTINLFEDAKNDVRDPELKTLIENTIPKLKAHLEMSREMQQKLSGNAQGNTGNNNTNNQPNR